MTVVTQTPSNEFHDNMTFMFFFENWRFVSTAAPLLKLRNQKLASRLDGRRFFFRKVAFRLDGSPLSEHSRGSRGSRGSPENGGSNCCSDPPTSRAGGQDDGSYTNSLK